MRAPTDAPHRGVACFDDARYRAIARLCLPKPPFAPNIDGVLKPARRWAVSALALMALGACPKLETPSVSTECTKQFTKCKLPDGPLGVCAEVPCKTGGSGPCFKCMSQH